MQAVFFSAILPPGDDWNSKTPWTGARTVSCEHGRECKTVRFKISGARRRSTMIYLVTREGTKNILLWRLRWTWSSFEQIRLNRKRKYVGFVVRWPASVFWRIFLVSVFPSHTPHSMVCVSGYRPFSSDIHPQPCQMDSRTPSSSLCLMFKSVQLNSFFKLDYFHCTIYQSWLAKMSQECICYQLLLHLPTVSSDPSKL